jgi:hypothetical protein
MMDAEGGEGDMDGEGDEFEMDGMDGMDGMDEMDEGLGSDDSNANEAFAIALSNRVLESANRTEEKDGREEKDEKDEKESKEKEEEKEEEKEDEGGMPFWFQALCAADKLLVCLCSRGLSSSYALPPEVANAAVDPTNASALIREHLEWKEAEDLQLVQMADKFEEEGAKLMKGAIRDIFSGEKTARLCTSTYTALKKKSSGALQRRLELLRWFNRRLEVCLPYINLAQPEVSLSAVVAASRPWTSANRLFQCRGLLFASVRRDFVDATLDRICSAETPDKPRVTIDRLAAATALESGDSERHSVLVQACRQIGNVRPSQLLAPRPSGSNAHTAFEVNFKGENAEGQGGPYRQFFCDVSRELQSVQGEQGPSAPLSLFMPCPNFRVGVGNQRDTFVPQVTSRSPTQLSYFHFLGRLLGIVNHALLALLLPSSHPTITLAQD